MHKRYIKSLDKLELSKKNLLDKLSGWTPENLCARKNGKWSALEHCYHIYLAEEASLKYVVKKLSFNPDLKDAGILHLFRLSALKFIEISPFKFKAPAAISEQAFPGSLTLDFVKMKWSESRTELHNFFENIDDKYVDKEIYKQPSVGRLTLNGMLQFLQFHLDRHAGHIEKQK